ncbi:hypothetical protein ZIOFF_069576 [Zingiber officinale]|uniref:Uncharacterized protein n=1 Tax=Zingiber officinale TaxID=94328 RepID=A0A8J5CDU5_ZINOF|nr:hypothetical protein ZIOFF_069576 [Zingiber officinale]
MFMPSLSPVSASPLAGGSPLGRDGSDAWSKEENAEEKETEEPSLVELRSKRSGVVFVLEKACLEVRKWERKARASGFVLRIVFDTPSSDSDFLDDVNDYANYLKKQDCDPADYRPDIIHLAASSACENRESLDLAGLSHISAKMVNLSNCVDAASDDAILAFVEGGANLQFGLCKAVPVYLVTLIRWLIRMGDQCIATRPYGCVFLLGKRWAEKEQLTKRTASCVWRKHMYSKAYSKGGLYSAKVVWCSNGGIDLWTPAVLEEERMLPCSIVGKNGYKIQRSSLIETNKQGLVLLWTDMGRAIQLQSI